MRGRLTLRLVVVAVTGLLVIGCSCSNERVPTDGGDASDGSRLDGAPSDAWNPFIPRDGGPLAHEPCAEGLEVRRVEWPSATVAPYGVMAPLLAGHGDHLAALWSECQEGEVWWDCTHQETGPGIGWASFAASTGAVTGGGVLPASTWPQPRGPIGLGWTEDRWRIYFSFEPDPETIPLGVQIGWMDVGPDGMGASVTADDVFPFHASGRALGTTFVMAVPEDAEESPGHRYVSVHDAVMRTYVVDGPRVTDRGVPRISRNQRWIAFTTRTRDSLRPMVGRLDVDDGSYVFRELPAELFPGVGTPLPVVSVDETGRVVVSTRVFRGTRAEPPWRLRYIWLDRDLRVRASWTSLQEYSGGEWRSAVVGVGDVQLFVFALGRGLFAGISRDPGSIAGATRPLLLLGANGPDGREQYRLEAWSTDSTAYVAVAHDTELALVALACGH